MTTIFSPQRRLLAALLGCALLAACATPAGPGDKAAQALNPAPAAVQQSLAPSGTLRVGVYPGSPTSLVLQDGQERGLTLELGQELARQIGRPVQLQRYQRVAQVVEAVQRGEVDMTITNATAARAQLVDFSPPVVRLGLGLLVLPASPIQRLADMDRPGMRIGVSEGSSSQAALGRQLKQARVVAAPSLKEAAEMLRAGKLDAFATNQAILFEMADGLAGARVLDERWGQETLAIAVPKGRAEVLPWLGEFVQWAGRAGRVEQAARRAGLRGTLPPETPEPRPTRP